MFELLERLHDNKTEMSFLFPAVGGHPIKGRVEDIEKDKATIRISIEGEPVRIVTHPDNVIIIEKLAN